MKRYKAIFFDWDGTAVVSRKASADQVAALMKPLLSQGTCLAIISGTTMENIGAGTLYQAFTQAERANLFYGLGRGAYNYRFDREGNPEIFCDMVPDRKTMVDIHRACYEIHERLFADYEFPTDIIFSRPNYCKVDLMVENDRGGQLFFQESELERLRESLERHGIVTGLPGLLELAQKAGNNHGLSLIATTDAKYLEAGITSKSHNVDTILDYLKESRGILPEDCAFWGDEYVGMDEELYGSDSFMITGKSRTGDFYDVSTAKGRRPERVEVRGGGVSTFLDFLAGQVIS